MVEGRVTSMIKLSNATLKIGERELKLKEDLIFPKGSVSFVKGESGVGKTTLLYILAMISKQKDYDLYVNSELVDTQAKKETIRKNEIGMLYQNFNMLEELSLYDNLKLFANINSKKINEDKAKRLLKRFNLGMDLDRKFSSLSGGEKQRFSLACILLKNPSVIIADEPTSALDKNNADQLMDLLYLLAKKYNKTIIVSTHSKDYDNMADNIITMSLNQITQSKKDNHDEEKCNNRNKKLDHSFYFDMTKFRLKRMIRNSSLILGLMIVMLSLSCFLLNYSRFSQEEYSRYLNNSLENEVFMFSNDEEAILASEQLEQIEAIPNVNGVYPIFRMFGKLNVSGNDLGYMEVYPVYDFQMAFSQNECAVDSILFDLLGEQIELDIGGKKISLTVNMIYSMDKASMYSTETIGKVFIPYEYVKDIETIDVGGYVMEIETFLEYDNIAQKVNAINEDFVLRSSYEFFSNLLRNAKQQELFINIGSAVMVLISVVLFITVQVHEVRDKKQEMCIFQANGLNKKHVFTLELIENSFKFILIFMLSVIMSYGLVLLANQFILQDVTMVMSSSYIVVLLGILVFAIIIPALVSAFYMISKSPEDELRALF